jgi:hypothetical protein
MDSFDYFLNCKEKGRYQIEMSKLAMEGKIT